MKFIDASSNILILQTHARYEFVQTPDICRDRIAYRATEGNYGADELWIPARHFPCE